MFQYSIADFYFCVAYSEALSSSTSSKMRYRPTQYQLEKLDLYINSTLWGQELDGAGALSLCNVHSA
eukprot:SAG31_NODE_65_length_28565_cov_8.402914_6_plen_67_part_00